MSELETLGANVPRTGSRIPLFRLRQGYGACTLIFNALSFQNTVQGNSWFSKIFITFHLFNFNYS